MNNEKRRIWILNDEGLYNAWKSSKKPITKYIKENKEWIDEVILNVIEGKRNAHYLVYG